MQRYNDALKDQLEGYNFIERDRHSKDDFVTINCPEHGIYYKTVNDILHADKECPRCQFLKPSMMIDHLQEATNNLEQEEIPEIQGEQAFYFRMLITHKKTGLIFQKIGISKSIEDFNEYWNPWKWQDFEFEPIEKIECSLVEAIALQKLFQVINSHLKLTVPNELKFNHNKTYFWDEIWQARSKTIPILRKILQQKQKEVCSVCGKEIKDPTLDHEHIRKIKGTGYIRAVCCSQCNTFIARAENNAARHGISLKGLPEVLRNMADHLETKTNIIHPTEMPKRKKVGVREWNKVRKYYFKVWPRKKVLPKKPKYVTDSWLEMKRAVDEHIANIELEKQLRKKKKRTLNDVK